MKNETTTSEPKLLSPEAREHFAKVLLQLEQKIQFNYFHFAKDTRIQDIHNSLRTVGYILEDVRQIASLLTGKKTEYSDPINERIVVFEALGEYLVEISEGVLESEDVENIAFTVQRDATEASIAEML